MFQLVYLYKTSNTKKRKNKKEIKQDLPQCASFLPSSVSSKENLQIV